MLYFSRLRILATALIAGVICLLAVPNFLPQDVVQFVPELAAAPARARPRSAGRLAHSAGGRLQGRAEGTRRDAARRRAPHPARRPGIGYDGPRHPGAHRPGPHSRCRTTCARRMRRLRELSQPLERPALGQRRSRTSSSSMPAAARSGSPSRRPGYRSASARRSISRSRSSPPRRRARHRRAVDPAPGRRPHPGAGAGPAGSRSASRS